MPMPPLESFALPAVVLLVKATCLLLVAFAASLLLQRASAGSRHLVWLVAVIGLLALPGMSAWAPVRVPVLPAQLSANASEAAGARTAVDAKPVGSRLNVPAVDMGADGSRAASDGDRSEPSDGAATATSEILAVSQLGLGTALLAAWAAIALGLVLWLGYGAWSVRRIVARAEPLDDPAWQAPLYEIADRLGLEAAPRLLRSEDVRMPFAAGLVSSTIVLPAESDGWSAERRTAVLVHELGHVRRRDLVGHTLGRVACAFWWFHPLAWTAARRLRAESERACDDLALVFGARPSDYAEHLLDIVSCVRDHNTPAVALAMAHRREFEGRMLAILDPALERRGMGRLQTVGLVGGLAVLALAVGAAAPVPRTAAPVAPAPGTRVAVADSSADIGVLVDSAGIRVAVNARHPGASSSSAASQPTTVANRAGAAKFTAGASSAVRSALAIVAGDTNHSSRRAEVLAKMLRSDSSAEIRRIAAWGLNDYGENAAAVDALAAALTGDSDASVREMAAWALSDADESSAAAAALVKALRQDKDARVRATATWALGEVGDASAVDALVPVLSDANADTRELAAWSIGSCEPKKAPAALVALLGDRDRDVRLSATWALYSIEDPDATGALEAAYKRETDPEIRIGMIRALGAMGERSVDALQGLVSSTDPQIRKTAVTALAGGEASGPWPWPRPMPRPFPDEPENER
jgi:HEAT repeat protein/beta-lactamase regulating signal transducer with metallopeptidase domain